MSPRSAGSARRPFPPMANGWSGRSARPISPRIAGRYDLWRLDLSRKGAKPEPLVAEPDVNENDPQIVGTHRLLQLEQGRRRRDLVGAGRGRRAAQADRLPGRLRRVQGRAERRTASSSGRTASPMRRASRPRSRRRIPMPARAASTTNCSCAIGIRWVDGSHSQLFVLPLTAAGAPGDGVAIEHGLDGDTPSRPFGGGEEVSWSADGKTVYFALRVAGTHRAAVDQPRHLVGARGRVGRAGQPDRRQSRAPTSCRPCRPTAAASPGWR